MIKNDIPVKIQTNPIINPPISNNSNNDNDNPNDRIMSDSFKKLIESFDENTKVIALMMMLPKIHKKYAAEPVPVLLNLFNALCIENIPHIDFMTKYWESIGDYRYKRSLPEWNEIVKYANETSAKSARNKYYGIDQSSGKEVKVKLSINEIKQKMKEIKNFDEQFLEHYIAFSIFGLTLADIVASDPELLEEYKKMECEYDNDNDNNIKNKVSLKTEIKKNAYAYNYYKAIHPIDHDLYEKQKQDKLKGIRKSKPDGRRECRIKESQIPLHIRQKYTNYFSSSPSLFSSSKS